MHEEVSALACLLLPTPGTMVRDTALVRRWTTPVGVFSSAAIALVKTYVAMSALTWHPGPKALRFARKMRCPEPRFLCS